MKKLHQNTKLYESAKEYRKLCDEVAIRFGTMYAHPSTQNWSQYIEVKSVHKNKYADSFCYRFAFLYAYFMM